MKKIGAVIQDFGPSQIAYEFLKSSNGLLSKRLDVSIYGFYENLTKAVMNPIFATMNFTEIFGFDGILITTSALQTHQSLQFPRPSKRIFYSWDIEWVRHKGIGFELQCEIYRNPKIEVWARNQNHASLIENNFNTKCKINENFDILKFLEE